MYNLVGTILLLCVQSVSGVPPRIRGAEQFFNLFLFVYSETSHSAGAPRDVGEGEEGVKKLWSLSYLPPSTLHKHAEGGMKKLCPLSFPLLFSQQSFFWHLSRQRKKRRSSKEGFRVLVLSFKPEQWISRKM